MQVSGKKNNDQYRAVGDGLAERSQRIVRKAKILRTMVQKCVLYSAGVSKNLLLCAMMTTLVLGALLKPAHAWIATADTKPTCDACNWK